MGIGETASEVEQRFAAHVPLAVVLVLLAGGGATFAAWPERLSDVEGAAVFLWCACLLFLNIFVLGPVTRFTGVEDARLMRRLVTFCSFGLFLLPLAIPVCRRGQGKAAGAAQGGAALMTVTRAWQLVGLIEKARLTGTDLEWGLGHRMYFMSAWSWHDLERTRVISTVSQRAAAGRLMRSLVGWVAFAACCVPFVGVSSDQVHSMLLVVKFGLPQQPHVAGTTKLTQLTLSSSAFLVVSAAQFDP